MAVEGVHGRHEVVRVPHHEVVLALDERVQDEGDESVAERGVPNLPDGRSRDLDDVVRGFGPRDVPQLDTVVGA